MNGLKFYVEGHTDPIMTENKEDKEYLDCNGSTGVGVFQSFLKGMMKNEKLSELMVFFSTLGEKMQEPKVFFEKKYEVFAAKAEMLEEKWREIKILKNESNKYKLESEEKKEKLAKEAEEVKRKLEKTEEILKEQEKKKEEAEIYNAPKTISDAELATYAKNHPFLKKVDLYDCRKLTDVGIIKLAENCKDIRELNLRWDNVYTPYTDKAIIAIGENCKNLTDLNLLNCNKVTDLGIKVIGENCKNLTDLNLLNCSKVTDEGIKVIGENCKNLTALNLWNCSKVTDEGIKVIGENCPNLKNIWLSGTAVSEVGRKELKKAIGGLEIKN
jgi:hypothetical protein